MKLIGLITMLIFSQVLFAKKDEPKKISKAIPSGMEDESMASPDPARIPPPMIIPAEIRKKYKLNDGVPEVEWKVFNEFDQKTKTAKAALKDKLGKKIRLIGFMIPTDYEIRKLKEFLFVPYTPACMHVPPPPVNQIILTKLAKGKAIDMEMYPAAVTGIVKLNTDKKSEQFFTMEASDFVYLKD